MSLQNKHSMNGCFLCAFPRVFKRSELMEWLGKNTNICVCPPTTTHSWQICHNPNNCVTLRFVFQTSTSQLNVYQRCTFLSDFACLNCTLCNDCTNVLSSKNMMFLAKKKTWWNIVLITHYYNKTILLTALLKCTTL